MTKSHEMEAKIDYISKPGGVKVQDPEDDHWYNPVNENIKARVKSDLRQDDFVIVKYKDVPDTDDKRYLLDFTKPGESTTNDVEDDTPEAFQQDDDVAHETKGSRYQTEHGTPRVEMPTRHGALNTAMKSIELQVKAGKDLPSDDAEVMRIIRDRADTFIEYIYHGSQQEWKDNKVQSNHD
jgi:hypothetical protein